MRTVNAKKGCVIPIGRLGENEVTTVVFDISDYPAEGTLNLLFQRNGDTAAYPCIIERDGNSARWTVKSSDVAVSGYGKCELIYLAGSKIAKSEIYTTVTGTALDGSGEVPEPWESWVDTVLSAKASAELSAFDASASSASAYLSEQHAAAYAEAAGAAAAEAVQVETNRALAAEAALSEKIDNGTKTSTGDVLDNTDYFNVVDKYISGGNWTAGGSSYIFDRTGADGGIDLSYDRINVTANKTGTASYVVTVHFLKSIGGAGEPADYSDYPSSISVRRGEKAEGDIPPDARYVYISRTSATGSIYYPRAVELISATLGAKLAYDEVARLKAIVENHEQKIDNLGDYNSLKNKPTKVSQFENDAGYMAIPTVTLDYSQIIGVDPIQAIFTDEQFQQIESSYFVVVDPTQLGMNPQLFTKNYVDDGATIRLSHDFIMFAGEYAGRLITLIDIDRNTHVGTMAQFTHD